MPVTPVTAVLFDVHSTLLHGGDPHAWLAAGLARAGRSDGLAGLEDADATATWLDRVWEHARVLDPEARRDLSPAEHRRVWDETTADGPGLDPPLADALYDVMTDHWTPYDDTLPVLDALRARGVRVGALSNIGFDLRPLFERIGLTERLDALVLSYEAGVAKPDPAIFRHALAALGSTPQETLMVGDSWQDDAGAAGIGVRTLVLPRTDGPEHGLDLVLRLVG
ncbi:HAD family hydrolase [Lapillicoccus jejuensis]|uniref:HAD superfamily hydrolase (TIGR01493 family)/HAD superfamily hydrolase (TIGR01509 family)/HAD superfamily hydrolase (TIGR01549 family) n=1 Tax=Lapillicoccus jejuensis TaxID=402171 RepID=A0A542DZN6_9MICO|nr:HAD-IA family hydrolase [Lapillicoccus jejuensis]TQJ08553.1 HAD superfamily hydrolase (TIGR01493 family)/HAD superfamily hydrolase (TIGR01509 family)/HAD superfamily hydrolase (TIGR01549 family) [Lapillicoccus jejuensis]